jgi:hypothetical protein
MQNRLWRQQLCDLQAEGTCSTELSTQTPSKSDVSWKWSSVGHMFVGRIVALASETGHTGVRWCHRAGMSAPTCTQFAFKCEYWAGQSLFLPFLLSHFTRLRTFFLSPVFYLFPSLFPLPLLLLPHSSHPYYESCFLSSFSQHILFPVSSVFYT